MSTTLFADHTVLFNEKGHILIPIYFLHGISSTHEHEVVEHDMSCLIKLYLITVIIVPLNRDEGQFQWK